MANLQMGIIGCGGRGRGHMRCLDSFDDVDLAAVCDPVAQSRDQAGDEFGVEKRYASVDELLDGAELDAVLVATPAHLIAETALLCLERGMDTLLEKPPGLSIEETRALRDAAARSGARGMVAWDRRFNPFVVEARQKVEERGPVAQVVGEFHKSLTSLEASGRFPDIILDNVMLETSIHAIDLVRSLGGSDVSEVHSVVQRRFHDHRDVHAALVTFENGCVAQIIANFTGATRLERYEIHGRDISAYLEGVNGGELVYDGERHEVRGDGPSSSEAEDRFFLDCIKEDRPIELPAANLDEAVKTMELCEAIRVGLVE